MRPACSVLCLNGGSSSLKFALYRMDEAAELRLADGSGDAAAGAAGVVNALARQGLTFDAIGHRIVHGGPEHVSPQLVTPSLIGVLKRCIPFAPVHLPAQIRLIETMAERYPNLPQAACFDTAFHRLMPEAAQRFPLPRRLWDEGIRKYGFHGLSYEFVLASLGEEAGRRTIVAHLGNGASLAAILDGAPVDTTMGLTPSGGIMMGTRTGDLDPGILLYLLRQKHYDAAALERLINDESGLLGVSGSTSDMKTLLENSGTQREAAQAVQMFCDHARKAIGALSTTLGGLDMLVFTGGIGEHAAPVRSEICRGLEYLGIHVSQERNSRNAPVISTPGSRSAVRVIATNEDLMIARHTRALLPYALT